MEKARVFLEQEEIEHMKRMLMLEDAKQKYLYQQIQYKLQVMAAG